MSTDIQTGKIPPLVSNVSTARSQNQGQSTGSHASRNVGHGAAADTVSMTDLAARLKQIESVLAAMPAVNKQLVAEIKQSIDNGSFDMDYAGTAARLIEMESAKSDSNSSQG